MKLIYVSVAKDPDDRQREIDAVRLLTYHNKLFRSAAVSAWHRLKAKDRALIIKEYGLRENVSDFMKILANESNKRRGRQ
jgi:hypothetical protein